MIKKEDDFKRNLHMFRMDGIESVLSVNRLKLTTLHHSHRFLRIVITQAEQSVLFSKFTSRTCASVASSRTSSHAPSWWGPLGVDGFRGRWDWVG